MKASHLRVQVLLLATSFIFAGIQPSTARPLTAIEKKTFERNFTISCMAGPHIRAAIRSAGGGPGAQSKYCKCAGAFFARTVTAAQAANPGLAPPSLHERAFRYCLPRALR